MDVKLWLNGLYLNMGSEVHSQSMEKNLGIKVGFFKHGLKSTKGLLKPYLLVVDSRYGRKGKAHGLVG